MNNYFHYERQILINEFGVEKQKILSNKTIMICGLGGLGSVVAYYLTAVGIGNIMLVDYDKVEITNLNRQILHNRNNLGELKVQSAFEKLHALNPDINIRAFNEKIDDEFLNKEAKVCDLLIDCLDNFKTREILNRFSYKNKIPYIYGSVRGFDGQLSFFYPPITPCFNCIFQPKNEIDKVPIIGATCGILGGWQAMEAIKYLAYDSSNFMNKILFFNAFDGYRSEVKIGKSKNCIVCA